MNTEPHDIIPTDAGEPAGPVFEDFEPLPGGDHAPAGSEGLEAVHDVPVKVQAVLGRARMPVGELLHLTAGTVVELDRRVGEPVDIFVNDRLIARGEVVLIDNALGVTLTEIIRQDR
jgi:flagellar motor switch protein FliN/FliY